MKFLFFLPLSFVIFSCSAKGEKADDSVSYGAFSVSDSLDPATEYPGSSVTGNLYEGLVDYNEKRELVSVLAESYSISDDEKTYTFNLRRGVQFQDGTPFNADAVLFSYLRQHQEDHPFHAYGPYVQWVSSGFKDNIEAIEKVDDYKVKITLKKVDGVFLSKLTQPFAYIVSPTQAMKTKESFSREPSGTGPFKLVEWKKGQHMVLERNEGYWNKSRMPHIKQLIIKEMVDANVRLLSFKKGDVDFINAPRPQDLEDFKNDPTVEIIRQPIGFVQLLMMNNEKKPFDNVNVRQAIAHLVNKEGISRTVLRGIGSLEVNPLPKGMPYYNEKIVDYDYDVKKAKDLLIAAGYPNGFETDIYYNEGNFNRKAVAEIIQSDMEKVGIKVSIKTTDWATFVDIMKNGKYGMGIYGWTAEYFDPESYFGSLLSKAAEKPARNVAFFRNEEFDSLVNGAVREKDKNKRGALYEKAQELFHEQIPAIPLYTYEQVYLARKGISGIVNLETGRFFFELIRKDKH